MLIIRKNDIVVLKFLKNYTNYNIEKWRYQKYVTIKIISKKTNINEQSVRNTLHRLKHNYLVKRTNKESPSDTKELNIKGNQDYWSIDSDGYKYFKELDKINKIKLWNFIDNNINRRRTYYIDNFKDIDNIEDLFDNLLHHGSIRRISRGYPYPIYYSIGKINDII